MPAVTAGHVNRVCRWFSAVFRPDFAVLGGQSAQQVGGMVVVLAVKELLSPQAAAGGECGVMTQVSSGRCHAVEFF